MKPITAIGLALAAAITWKLLHKRSQKVGAMTDPMPTLDNLKRGIANGWYTALGCGWLLVLVLRCGFLENETIKN